MDDNSQPQLSPRDPPPAESAGGHGASGHGASGHSAVEPTQMPPSPVHSHAAEPADLALSKAKEFAPGKPVAGWCDECGRRLAAASIQWSDWVVRRVERVRFRDDRTVNRLISIDFLVRADAPVYQAPGGKRYWLVPVSVMRRKTLVNYYLHDEGGRSIPLPGLRLTQLLDESLLRAVASRELNGSLNEDAVAFIHEVIAGERDKVDERMKSLDEQRAPAQIQMLADETHVFYILLNRLSYRYTLYAFLDADEHRHRVLHMSIDEPLTFYYRETGLTKDGEDEQPGDLTYGLGKEVPWWNRHRLAAALGWTATKVRFPVPAAENASSFHFEVEAPKGVDIVEATILAGLPDHENALVAPSFDQIRMRLPTVGLHVTGVPNGSSSRAQVHLQVATRGWYTTMLLTCWATFLLLGAIYLHARSKSTTTPNDIVVVLAGVAAAVATLIAQGEFAGMASRLIGLPRALAAVEAALPLIAATLFVFSSKDGGHQWTFWLLVLAIIAAVISVTITIPWLQVHRSLRKYDITSPWEMAPDIKKAAEKPDGFWLAAEAHGYKTPAIRVDSAEAWHQQFRWTEQIEAHAGKLLSRPAPVPVAAAEPDAPPTRQ